MINAASAAASSVHAGEAALALRRCGSLLEEHLYRLAALPMHGNRMMKHDRLVKGLLLSFFTPMARSLRRIQDCGDFGGSLDLQQMARSTTSDALAVFDPQLLLPLIRDLQQRVPQLGKTDDSLAGTTQRILAADGTYMTTICDVVWAMHHTRFYRM